MISLRATSFVLVLLLAAAPEFTQAQVTLGQAHTCALLADNTVRCWGANDVGQAAAGSRTAVGDEQDELLTIEALEVGGPVAQIEAGGFHTCALRQDGGIRCWGDGADGKLGQGDTQTRGTASDDLDGLPDVALGTTASRITAGFRHTCALTSAGGVRCWGSGTFGQTGTGSTTALGDAPGEIAALSDLPLGRPATAVVAGAYHTCALLDDATVKCWGLDSFGQLGRGSNQAIGDAPDEVATLVAIPIPPARAVVAGFGHTCALLTDGRVSCWGDGFFGQLGYGSTDIIGDEPGEVAAAPPIQFSSPAAELTAGRDHTCARLGDGSVTCWGLGSFGQTGMDTDQRLGDEPGERADLLSSLALPLPVLTLDAGATHTCAVLDDMTLRCWGSGAQGRLGLGDTQTRGAQSGDMAALPTVPIGADVLPVELVSFEGVASGSRVVLRWQTAAETNNAGFVVEHASLAEATESALPTPQLWTPLHTVAGAGTTVEAQRYAWTTPELAPGRHRFRLRQRDLDGSEHLSPVVEVAVGLDGAGFVLTAFSPNPARDGSHTTLHVTIRQHVRADVIDLLGRTVTTVWDSELSADRAQPLHVDAARLGAGLYLLRVQGERFVTTTPLRVVR